MKLIGIVGRAYFNRDDQKIIQVNEDIRKVFTTEEVLSYFGAGLGLQNAIRFYNKKNILNPYRVLNKAVPLYIEYDGDIMMKNPGTIMNKYLLDLGQNNKR